MTNRKIKFKNKGIEKNIQQEPIVIGQQEYVCLKKSGPTDNSSCVTEGKWGEYMPDPRVGDATEYLPEYEALCRCHKPEHLCAESDDRDPNSLPPLKDLASKVPLFREPMLDEIDYSEMDIDECELIRSQFTDGDNYLGCLPTIPNSPLNCECESPFGEETDPDFKDSRFAEYVRTSRTYSTFWDTPRKTPLLRKSLMNLYSAEVAVGTMPGNLSLKVGDFIEVFAGNENLQGNNTLSGTWLVAKIVFTIPATGYHKNIVTLIRDTKGTWEEKTSIQSDVEDALDLGGGEV